MGYFNSISTPFIIFSGNKEMYSCFILTRKKKMFEAKFGSFQFRIMQRDRQWKRLSSESRMSTADGRVATGCATHTSLAARECGGDESGGFRQCVDNNADTGRQLRGPSPGLRSRTHQRLRARTPASRSTSLSLIFSFPKTEY